jgi:NAD(P)-dependent dehydrogenase (short-subunit alcohol dehydrogenase family)
VPDMKDLNGKVAVITGGGSGIGRAMAERFAAAGMHIVLADVDEVRLRTVEADLGERGTQVLPVLCDTSLEESVQELARRTLERFGGAHVLCNNAGVAGVGDPWNGPMSVWEWVVDINLYGVVHGIRAFLPIMLDQGEGHIVNTASMAGLLAMPGLAPYNATKSAVVAISEGLFVEQVAKGSPVRVSVLCPSFVKSNLMVDPKWIDRLGAQPADTSDPIGAAMTQMLQAGVEEGLEASEVADMVHDAVIDERFWILTHDDMKSLPVERMQRAAAGENPA